MIFFSYKQYFRSQCLLFAESIIAPQMLDLSGDFYQQLDNVLSAVRLTQQEVCAVSSLYSDLQDALRTLWPGRKSPGKY